MILRYALMFLFLILVSSFLPAQLLKTGSLQIGDKAPAFIVKEWIKGPPIPEFRKGHVYVLEFSAVSCPPCRKAIPHLSDLAEQYRGLVTVVSMYTMESNLDDTTDLMYLTNTHRLVETLGSKIRFSVAADVPLRKTAETWGIKGTPFFFVVDQSGLIAWFGYNLRTLVSILPQILTNKLDVISVFRKEEKFDSCLSQVTMLKEHDNYLRAERKIDSLVQAFPEYEFILYDYRFNLLAAINEKRAYEFLRWMLAQKLEGFGWDKFLASTWVSFQEPDYELVLLTADRAIGEAENDHEVATLLMEKAAIFRHRAWSKPLEDSKKYYEAAFSLMCEALKRSRLTEEPAFSDQVQNTFYYYEFLHLSVADNANANDFLRWMLKNKLEKVDWFNLINDALLIQKRPDIKLLIKVVDFSYRRSKSKSDHGLATQALGWKAKLLSINGKKRKSVKTYEEVIKRSVRYLDRQSTEIYKKRLAEL